MTRILVTGATGFIGRRLVAALDEQGHEVRAMTRRPESYDGPGEPVAGDVHDADSLVEPLAGVEIAYYLVHSLDDADFERKDAEAARAFAKAGGEAGRAADRLPRRSRRGGQRHVGAPALAPRGRGSARRAPACR